MDSAVKSHRESVDPDVGVKAACQSEDAAHREVAVLHHGFFPLKHLPRLHIHQSCASHDTVRGRTVCASDEVEQRIAAVRMCHAGPKGALRPFMDFITSAHAFTYVNARW